MNIFQRVGHAGDQPVIGGHCFDNIGKAKVIPAPGFLACHISGLFLGVHRRGGRIKLNTPWRAAARDTTDNKPAFIDQLVIESQSNPKPGTFSGKRQRFRDEADFQFIGFRCCPTIIRQGQFTQALLQHPGYIFPFGLNAEGRRIFRHRCLICHINPIS